MEPELLFFAMPALIGTGAALVTAVIMQARAEAGATRHKEAIAELRALLHAQRNVLEDRVRAAEETARRRALDEFMGDIHVENRELSSSRAVVLQERVCFRNIPLTGWVEREIAPPLQPDRPVTVLPNPLPGRLRLTSR